MEEHHQRNPDRQILHGVNAHSEQHLEEKEHQEGQRNEERAVLHASLAQAIEVDWIEQRHADRHGTPVYARALRGNPALRQAVRRVRDVPFGVEAFGRHHVMVRQRRAVERRRNPIACHGEAVAASGRQQCELAAAVQRHLDREAVGGIAGKGGDGPA